MSSNVHSKDSDRTNPDSTDWTVEWNDVERRRLPISGVHSITILSINDTFNIEHEWNPYQVSICSGNLNMEEDAHEESHSKR